MAVRPQDKRRFPRINVEVPLRYQVRGRPEFSNTITDNLSISGLGFPTDKFIAPSVVLMLEINVLSRTLNLIGKVAWSAPLPHCNNYCTRIEFIELYPREKQYLQDYLSVQPGKI